MSQNDHDLEKTRISVVSSGSPRSTPRAKKKEVPKLSAEEQEKKNRKHQKKEELTREHDKIISEIEQNASMDTALKTVYTLGHVGRFQKKLEKRIRNGFPSILIEIAKAKRSEATRNSEAI